MEWNEYRGGRLQDSSVSLEYCSETRTYQLELKADYR